MERLAQTEPRPRRHPASRHWRRWLLGGAVLVGVGSSLWFWSRAPVENHAEATLRQIATTTGLVLNGRLANLPSSKMAPIHRGDDQDNQAQLQLKATRQDLEQRLIRTPTPAGHRALGRFYLAEGKPLAAFAHLQLAVQAFPWDAGLQSDFGLALLEAARTSPEAATEALEAFDEALRLQPDLLEAHYNRARALEILGRPTEALAAWRAYAARDAQSAWGAAARDRAAFLERYGNAPAHP
ncbi:hypothetical protein J8C06_01245 [Chloracidobacterium validum]|uniref:Tetratricopeptide repeat protein n=1 Tax=Chloracidobacterium validum TaxID=2821543 RepID=A0ABX8B813_9BACT|nr:tetratricopeptide repeat protein [Chloracidobacterium validum]QUW03099.1 hypothetical protein J8C06_01245 [Chloracidobacterium validum]